MFKIYPIISNTYKSKWNNEITELKFVYIIYIFFIRCFLVSAPPFDIEIYQFSIILKLSFLRRVGWSNSDPTPAPPLVLRMLHKTGNSPDV